MYLQEESAKLCAWCAIYKCYVFCMSKLCYVLCVYMLFVLLYVSCVLCMRTWVLLKFVYLHSCVLCVVQCLLTCVLHVFCYACFACLCTSHTFEIIVLHAYMLWKLACLVWSVDHQDKFLDLQNNIYTVRSNSPLLQLKANHLLYIMQI